MAKSIEEKHDIMQNVLFDIAFFPIAKDDKVEAVNCVNMIQELKQKAKQALLDIGAIELLENSN